MLITGIYVLFFETDDGLFYVGQSIDIHNRYKDHCSALRSNRHHNSGLQELYNQYNMLPSMEILETTSDLDNREIHWIKEFDSFYNGLNKTLGGSNNQYGELAANALYSNEDYSCILFMLLQNTPVEVSKELGISVDIISSIYEGRAHKYLSVLYPVEYSKMLSVRESRTRRLLEDSVYLNIYKDLANTDLTHNIIASKYNVPVSIIKDISRENTHKYLKDVLPEEYKKILAKRAYPIYYVKDPLGTIHKIVTSISEFARIHGLQSTNLNHVIHGKRKAHLGWTVAEAP